MHEESRCLHICEATMRPDPRFGPGSCLLPEHWDEVLPRAPGEEHLLPPVLRQVRRPM